MTDYSDYSSEDIGKLFAEGLRETLEAIMSWDLREIGIVPCRQCGCLSNETCGHDPYDYKEGCTLQGDRRCPCCHVRDN